MRSPDAAPHEPDDEGELESLAAELRSVLGKTGASAAPEAAGPRERAEAGDAPTTGMAAGPAAAAPKLGDRLGDFELLSELGRGGMGVVYRAKQISLNRLVALKLLQADALDAPDRLLRFRNECRAVAKLSHPAIVPIYAQGEAGSLLYYAMELVEGESLDRLIARAGLPPGLKAEGEAARFWASRFAEVAHALHHAHSKQVFHRDIKPANLILDREGKLHILDFGIARIVDVPGLTLTGQLLGTPAYLAPEQVGAASGRADEASGTRPSLSRTSGGGSAGDQRSDVYALGVTLYETLTGAAPFRGAGVAEVLRQVAEMEPPPPRRLNPTISRDLEAVILQALRKDPAKRYQTAAALAHDLEAVAAGTPVKARSASPVEKAVRLARAHPASAAIAAVALLLTIVLLLTDHLLVLLLGLTLLAVAGAQLNLARRRTMKRLVGESLHHLLHESYLDLEAVRPKLARAQRLGCRSTDFHVAQAITRLGQAPDQAARKLERVLEREPNHRIAMYLLAWSHRLQGHVERCREWVRRAEESGGPHTPEEHFLCGIAIIASEIDRAIACFRQAIAHQPDFTQALLHLGRALNQWLYRHRDLSHFNEQTACLQSLCLLRPTSAYPRYLLSLAYRLAAEVHVDRAKRDSAADSDRHEYEAQALLAKAYEAAKQAQLLEPTSGRGYAAEAAYFEQRGDYYTAIAAWDGAFRYEAYRQTREEVHQYRFRLAWWTSQLERAMWDLEALQLLVPEDPFLVMLYPALVLTELRQPSKAIAWLDAAELPGGDKAFNERVRRATGRLLGETPAGVRLVDFDPGEADPATGQLTPADLYFAGVELLTRGDGPAALAWLDAAVRTYDNEQISFHALALATKLRRSPNWPAELVATMQAADPAGRDRLNRR